MARIAIDMDGVLADTYGQYIKWFHQKYGVNVPREALNGLEETTGFAAFMPNDAKSKLLEDSIYDFLYQPGFFRDKAVIGNAIAVVEELQKDHEIFIVSAAMEFPQSLVEKWEWLQEHFPFIHWRQIVFCGSKSIIDADYMIDDYDKNLRSFKGTPLLFSSPHNIGNPNYDRYERFDNWDQIRTYFKKLV
jgi:5'-nucleotidase